jgi:hypothetical protein
VVVVVVLVDDWSLPLEHPVTARTASAPAARNAIGFDCMGLLLLTERWDGTQETRRPRSATGEPSPGFVLAIQ